MCAIHNFRLFLLLLTLGCLAICCSFASSVAAESSRERPVVAQTDDHTRLLIAAARVFDGNDLRNNAAVLVAGGEIIAVGSPDELRGQADREMNLGDSTILPGFIELHAHMWLCAKFPATRCCATALPLSVMSAGRCCRLPAVTVISGFSPPAR
jgi:hypothetical protein